METPTLSKPTKDKTCQKSVITLTLILLVGAWGSIHVPKQLTWEVVSQTGDTIWSITNLQAPYTWWPSLYPDFCKLAAGIDTWDIPTIDPHTFNRSYAGNQPQTMTAHRCGSPTARCHLAKSDFYVCPKDNRDRATVYKYGGYEYYFCSQWGCETTGDAYWKPSSSWDLITIKGSYIKPDSGGCTSYYSKNGGGWAGQQNAWSLPLNITFTSRGRKNDLEWTRGYTWGLR